MLRPSTGAGPGGASSSFPDSSDALADGAPTREVAMPFKYNGRIALALLPAAAALLGAGGAPAFSCTAVRSESVV